MSIYREIGPNSGTFLMILFLVSNCHGLECYKCTDGWTSDTCTESTITCGSGEICSNTVIRKQFFGRVYTKGCLEAEICFDLQSLNNWKTCRETPSKCVYCCQDTLCNQGQPGSFGLPLLIMISVFIVAVFS